MKYAHSLTQSSKLESPNFLPTLILLLSCITITTFSYDWHNQFVRLTYTCNLGNNMLRSLKIRSGSKEERKRVNKLISF